MRKFFKHIISSIWEFILPEKEVEFCKDSIYEKYIINPLNFFIKIYYESGGLLFLSILLVLVLTNLNLLLSIVLAILAPITLIVLSYRIYYFINYVVKNRKKDKYD